MDWKNKTRFQLSSKTENVFPVGQETHGSAWMMRKMKCSWELFRRGGSKGEKAAGENARMLPKTTREEGNKQEAKKRGKLKNVAGKLLKAIASGKEAEEKKPENENLAGNLLKIATCKKEVEGKKSAEETICGFIEQGKFFQACKHIYNLEHSGSDGMGKSESLYKLLAERMWSIMGKAFSGSDRMLLEPLQSVGESLKWEKQKKEEWFGRSQGMETLSTWSPRFWKKDLEKKLIKYMTVQIPPFGSTSNTDETALKQHLSQLEMTFLPSLERKSGFFEEAGLLVMYARCFHACLSSHLSTLTDNNHVSFSQCLLVYEWCLNMYKSGNRTLLGPSQTPHHRLSLDAQCLMRIILKTEEKLLAITQKEVGEALKEAFDIGKPPCASAAVIQVLTEKTEAAQRISESLRERVGAVCLEECLSFLESYGNEIRSFLQLHGGLGICSSLQILENCYILRAAWHKLTYVCSASTGQDVKVKGFLDQIEDETVEHLLQIITSKVKGPKEGSLKDPIKAILGLIQTSDAEGMKIALLPILREFPDLRSAVKNTRCLCPVAAPAITAPWEFLGLVQLEARSSRPATEDRIPALSQENHEAQILIFCAKARWCMKRSKQREGAESWWSFPGCGIVLCGGGNSPISYWFPPLFHTQPQT
ncbi:uncharacterized protein LOC112972706 isoform X6 [Apteryx rowi]|uniref:uncharacterized protein LOC112972706 isoform X6 n=1 Tax=Apteryx rowi TaxID=308060 RepID=UPI000E1E19AC|nr:uncharacterized protein LOC112972706 isoform X6 [Apteryx rowi]